MPESNRRHILLGAAAAVLLAPTADSWAAEGRVSLAPARDLPTEVSQAQRAGHPLIVLVSLEGCPFCRQVRDAFLGPLRDDRGFQVVQVDLRRRTPVRDFQGDVTTHDALTNVWKISVAPTVLFLGSKGRELAGRLVGAYLPDFYGAYLEERIDTARKAIDK